ncbi:MAG: DUF3576 domain-containing protein [Pseudomonadota bacterium]
MRVRNKPLTSVLLRGAGLAVLALMVGACDGNYSAKKDTSGPSGPSRNPNQETQGPGVFGQEVTVGRILDGTIISQSTEEGGSLPVNRFLWQASLQTLDFMPLASTDPFTGVIATDWSTPPGTAGERVKVTVYVTNPQLAASALKVAVFREVRSEEGVWTPATVNPDTPRQLEDAILTRARQIKIADLEAKSTG